MSNLLERIRELCKNAWMRVSLFRAELKGDIPKLVELHQNKNHLIRKTAGKAILRLRKKGVIPLLAKALAICDSFSHETNDLLETIVLLREPEGVSVLIDSLGDSIGRKWEGVALALGATHSPRGLEPLLQRHDTLGSGTIIKALGLIGQRDAIPYLVYLMAGLYRPSGGKAGIPLLPAPSDTRTCKEIEISDAILRIALGTCDEFALAIIHELLTYVAYSRIELELSLLGQHHSLGARIYRVPNETQRRARRLRSRLHRTLKSHGVTPRGLVSQKQRRRIRQAVAELTEHGALSLEDKNVLHLFDAARQLTHSDYKDRLAVCGRWGDVRCEACKLGRAASKLTGIRGPHPPCAWQSDDRRNLISAGTRLCEFLGNGVSVEPS